MDSISIDLIGSEIDSVVIDQPGRLCIGFSRAYLIKTLTGSDERTRWWQAGRLCIEDAELDSTLPTGPLICAGGDIDDNIYTYRDMIPIPLDSRGRSRCELRFEGEAAPLIVTGTALRLEMQGTPAYIEHLRPSVSSRP